jgi:hypothetical protein
VSGKVLVLSLGSNDEGDFLTTLFGELLFVLERLFDNLGLFEFGDLA